MLNSKKVLGMPAGAMADQVYKNLTADEREQMLIEASHAFEKFLNALKIDWKNDPNARETPMRVAKMYIDELLSGRFTDPPDIKSFDSTVEEGLIINGPIAIKSLCSHHFMPFEGFCTVGLVPSPDKNQVFQLPGLSKYARLVKWCSRRGYMQEKLGQVILQNLQRYIQSDKIGVFICARHLCCTHRGTLESQTQTGTFHMTDAFKKDLTIRHEFSSIVQTHIMNFK